LKKNEIEKLMNFINDIKDRCAFRFMSDCGLRVSEVCNLKIEDVNLEEREILVVCGKRKKDRTVPIPATSELLKLIPTVRNRRREGWLFLSNYSSGGIPDRSINARTLQISIKKYIKKAGLPEWISCHTLRHSYASYLAENRIGLEIIRDNLGHESLSTTSIYLHTQTVIRKEQVDSVKF